MALQSSDLFIVQRDQQSYKMPASEITSFVPPAPNVGDGTITIVQPGTSNQTFTVNQSGNTTITLKNDNTDTNTTYSAGNGLTLSGTTFSAKAGDNTVTIDGSGIKVNPGNLGISSGVTSITPGEGLRNGSSTGSGNSTAITSTGSLSVDNTVVRTSGNQTIGGRLTLGSGVVPTLRNITAGDFNLNNAIAWTCGAIAIPNPTNATPGQTGQILLTAAPTSWGSNFKFPDGEGNTQPDTTYPAIIPYFVQDASNILLGHPTGY